jgi:hypothetical protein
MEFLTGALGVELLVRMVVGFIAAVAGIALWAHSREPSWILVIAATLLGYVEVLLRFLEALGVTTLDAWTWKGLPVVRLAFAGGIPLLYALGLWGAIRAYRKP